MIDTHHIVAFIFNIGYQFAKLLKTINNDLFVIGLCGADAFEIEFS